MRNGSCLKKPYLAWVDYIFVHNLLLLNWEGLSMNIYVSTLVNGYIIMYICTYRAYMCIYLFIMTKQFIGIGSYRDHFFIIY